ncbi:ketoacyl-ACP synthase III [Barnesiella sp. WM24]|uniref:3-oxoacyl-ACP synthase III family protein n=1 Tax=Barnesiella sp. WM24 TaxID=2558278 RepID=UPI001071854A|nr:ketoacyl-ACP synthase III [Barnesiella sp. WM24]TFU92625.1 ketoacyl-ACP synthase III [Barnesiella sp. WM24]
MYINATGYYIPSERVDNEYFKDVNGLTSDWIYKRTGIKSRSKAGAGEGHNSMGLNAIEDAIKNLPYGIKDVDLIVSASYSPYDTVATLAHIAQRKYDITGAKAVYVSAACSSFVNGLEIIETYFAAGKAKKALLVCSEHNTYYSNEHDPKCGHLWGDAAVAYFLSADKVSDTDVKIKEIYTCGLGNVGKGPEGVILRPKEGGIEMPDGKDVFVNACSYMIDALDHVTKPYGMTPGELDHIITHQANKRIVAQVAHQLELDDDHFVNNIEELGNTGSASCALVFAQNRDKFKKGEKIGLTVFGGGYSCGAFLVEI